MESTRPQAAYRSDVTVIDTKNETYSLVQDPDDYIDITAIYTVGWEKYCLKCNDYRHRK